MQTVSISELKAKLSEHLRHRIKPTNPRKKPARPWFVALATASLALMACQAHGANRPTAPLPTTAPTTAPTPTPPARAAPAMLHGVRVELRELKKLRVVKWVYKKRFPTTAGLDGVIEIRIHNTGKLPIAVANIEHHGLLFVDTKTKLQHLVLHACKCAEAPDSRSAQPLTIAAGKVHKLVFDDWGCGGGMWKPPPKGQYRLQYRVLVVPAAQPKAPAVQPPTAGKAPRQSFVARRKACEKRLKDPNNWREAKLSNVLQIKLSEPIRKRMPQ